MRSTVVNAIAKYSKALKNSDWIVDEAYKFEFANFIQQNVDWAAQTDEEILEILVQSQRIKYTAGGRGIQFVQKSGRETLSEFISVRDVELFRQIHDGKDPENVNWENRTMSFTGLSAWLASLFPEQIYPVPITGFDETIKYLFDTPDRKFPKQGSKYLFGCQPFMAETESILREYPVEEHCLKEWNQFYASNPDLNIRPKETLSKVDWVWLVQDFHLFVYREILGLYRKKEKEIEAKEDIEPTVIEGASKLAVHMRFERNSGLIKKIKEQALKENKMLNCEVCGFSFLDAYGEIGEGFIEAHHKNPLSERDGETVTRREDIALVCSNCHRMLHRGDPVYSIEELKEKMYRS